MRTRIAPWNTYHVSEVKVQAYVAFTYYETFNEQTTKQESF